MGMHELITQFISAIVQSKNSNFVCILECVYEFGNLCEG